MKMATNCLVLCFVQATHTKVSLYNHMNKRDYSGYDVTPYQTCMPTARLLYHILHFSNEGNGSMNAGGNLGSAAKGPAIDLEIAGSGPVIAAIFYSLLFLTVCSSLACLSFVTMYADHLHSTDRLL